MSKTRFPSLRSLRAWAAARRRGHLAGSMWSKVIDRDLDRVASDLLFLSQSAEAPSGTARQGARPSTKPIDVRDPKTYSDWVGKTLALRDGRTLSPVKK